LGVIFLDPLPFVRLRHRSSRIVLWNAVRSCAEAEGGPGCCVCVSVSFFYRIACWYLDAWMRLYTTHDISVSNFSV
jgi:hypothetical protein